MNILQINKFFYARGGADKHYLELIKLLSRAGYNVIPFSMCLQKEETKLLDENLRAFYNKYNKYFISKVEFSSGRTLKDYLKLGRMFWSFEGASKLNRLIADLSFNNKNLKIIAHIHNIYHQISPSILPVLKKYKIPIVFTVHDFHFLSPIYAENNLEKIICQAELFLHNRILNIKKYIDIFIAPSNFVKKELIRFKIKEEKIKVLPNFFIPEDQDSFKIQSDKKEDYILYFGRLAPEKGVDILIKAYIKSGLNIPLYIVGAGPLMNDLKTKFSFKNANIHFLGNLDKLALKNIISGALFTVVPSKAPETFGMSVLESYQFKKPVISSDIGALPEIVKNNETGLLFKSGDINELSNKIKELAQNENLRNYLGQNGFNFVQNFSPENYLKKIVEIYQLFI